MGEQERSGSRETPGDETGKGWPVWLCETVETVHAVLDVAETATELGTRLPDALAENDTVVFAWVAAVDDPGVRVRSAPRGTALPPKLTGESGRETLTDRVESTGDVQTLTDRVPRDVRLALENAGKRTDRAGSFVGVPLTAGGTTRGVLHLYVTPEAANHADVLSSAGRAIGRRLRTFEMEAQLARERRRLESTRSLLSHDLGNPLTIATGRVQLARADDDTSHLDSVDGALERVDDLLDREVRLVEVGQQPVESEPISLAVLARDSWDDVGRDRGELVVEDVAFRGERRRVSVLLDELLRNALVHSDGPVTVELGPLSGVEGFYVEDDGPGIPDDERGYVLDTGYTTLPDREGLGLPIVTEIAGAHGWDVALGPGEPDGTRVEIVSSHW